MPAIHPLVPATAAPVFRACIGVADKFFDTPVDFGSGIVPGLPSLGERHGNAIRAAMIVRLILMTERPNVQGHLARGSDSMIGIAERYPRS
ncbi:hypothetical protein J1C56_19000 [Aminobacter anthyllidis]|uniref:Uncharacterized protein n=1 Tax=Aminobacter anthyllidis TaxID=1035067 RepID=A0A9X1AD50_9HYPH|nr:hypothetical protein [Aminobacter anthyllidis]MBT1157686.1 hypothetical protein [Aminobacter anthyllidis]